jgi:hypothetical protein
MIAIPILALPNGELSGNAGSVLAHAGNDEKRRRGYRCAPEIEPGTSTSFTSLKEVDGDGALAQFALRLAGCATGEWELSRVPSGGRCPGGQQEAHRG